MLSNSDWDIFEKITLESSQFISSSKIRGSLLTVLAGVSIGRVLYDRYQEWQAGNEYTIQINNSSMLEKVIDGWIAAAVSDENIPTLNVSIQHQRERLASKNPKKYLTTSISNDSIFYLNIDGRGATVYKRAQVNKKEAAAMPIGEDYGTRPSTTIIVSCDSSEDRQYILDKLNEGVHLIDGGRPNMYMSDRYGEFSQYGFVPKRPLESVVFSDSQKEIILASIDEFFKREDEYAALGIPYHHGILLYGPPGTGKTSVVTALATHLSMDIYSINMSSMVNDEGLTELVRAAPAGSFLLLEDVDIVSGMAERTSEVKGVTMSGILNVLDGIVTPPGVIIVLTSNDITRIDPAILRPGRIDVSVHVDYMDDEQLERLCTYFLGHIPSGLPTIYKDDMIVPADIVGCIKATFGNPEASAKAIVEEIWRKKNAVLSSNLSL